MYSVVLATMVAAGGTTADWGLLRCLFGNHSRGSAGIAYAPSTVWAPYCADNVAYGDGLVPPAVANGYGHGYPYNGYNFNYNGYGYNGSNYNGYGYNNGYNGSWTYSNGNWVYPNSSAYNWNTPGYYGYAGYPYANSYYGNSYYPYGSSYYPYASSGYAYNGYYPWAGYPSTGYGYLRNVNPEAARLQVAPPVANVQPAPATRPLSVAEVDALRSLLRSARANHVPQVPAPTPLANYPQPGFAPVPAADQNLPGQQLSPAEVDALRNLFGPPAHLQSLPGQSMNSVQANTLHSQLARNNASTAAAPGRVTVSLPAQARMWVDHKEAPRGLAVRTINTPPLQPGAQYFYDLTVEHVRDGETVRDSRRVMVVGGQETRVDFTGAKLIVAR